MNQSEMMRRSRRATASSPRSTSRAGPRPRRSRATAIEESAWSNDEEMFDLIHQMRSRIITAPCFGSGKVIGAILFERTMDGHGRRQADSAGADRPGRRPVHQDRQGPRGRGERRPDDEADARARRAARARQAAWRVRHQGALGDQLANRDGHCRGRRAAVRGRAPGARPRPDADHRARGEHQEPRARRRATASCSTRSRRTSTRFRTGSR